MNKFIIASLAVALVFGCLVLPGLVSADEGGLINEITDENDFDEDPDGGIQPKQVGGSLSDTWTKDTLETGVDKLTDGRSPTCAQANTKTKCEQCCNNLGLAASPRRSSKTLGLYVRCTCVERNN